MQPAPRSNPSMPQGSVNPNGSNRKPESITVTFAGGRELEHYDDLLKEADEKLTTKSNLAKLIIMAHVKGASVTIPLDAQALEARYEGKLAALREQNEILTDKLESRSRQSGLAGAKANEKTVEQLVEEGIERARQADRIARIEAENIAFKKDNRELEEELEEMATEYDKLLLTQEAMRAEIERLKAMDAKIEKFGPTLAGLVLTKFPKIGQALEALSGGLAGLPEGLDENDRAILDWAKQHLQGFSYEERGMVDAVLNAFAVNKSSLLAAYRMTTAPPPTPETA